MTWFTKAARWELNKRGFKIIEIEHPKFNFVAETKKGKRAGVMCKPHGHVYAPEKRKLLIISRILGLDMVYVVSEKYVSDSGTHELKITELTPP